MGRIETCEQIIGYRFRNTKYIRQALVPLASINQRLALVGDRVADAQLASRWYDDKKQPSPSEWAFIRNSLVSNKNLAEVGVRLRIRDCTFPRCGTGRSMANTMEAIIGAVWLDSKCDFGAVDAVMERLGLTKYARIRSPKTPFTTNQPRCEIEDIQSSRSLPDRFFVGHHVGLLQLLFKHSQSFIVQQRADQHGDLSPHEPAREAATMHIMPETAQKRTAAPVTRKQKQSGQEPGPSSNTTKPPKRQAPEPVLASDEQTNAEHDDSALDSALPEQQPVTLGDHGSSLAGLHDGSTGWHPEDTECNRLRYFIWSVKKDRDQRTARRNKILRRLRAHSRVLLQLPGRSLKNMPNDFPAEGVFLRTHCEDPQADRSLALHAEALRRLYDGLWQMRQKGTLRPEDKEQPLLARNELVKVVRARLELWLPPSLQKNAHENQIPPSLPNRGQPSANSSANSSETPESGLPATAAVDSTRVSTAEPCEHKSPHRPGSVLWTTHTAQHNSVDWKQYLSKPASENQESA